MQINETIKWSTNTICAFFIKKNFKPLIFYLNVLFFWNINEFFFSEIKDMDKKHRKHYVNISVYIF